MRFNRNALLKKCRKKSEKAIIDFLLVLVCSNALSYIQQQAKYIYRIQVDSSKILFQRLFLRTFCYLPFKGTHSLGARLGALLSDAHFFNKMLGASNYAQSLEQKMSFQFDLCECSCHFLLSFLESFSVETEVRKYINIC